MDKLSSAARQECCPDWPAPAGCASCSLIVGLHGVLEPLAPLSGKHCNPNQKKELEIESRESPSTACIDVVELATEWTYFVLSSQLIFVDPQILIHLESWSLMQFFCRESTVPLYNLRWTPHRFPSLHGDGWFCRFGQLVEMVTHLLKNFCAFLFRLCTMGCTTYNFWPRMSMCFRLL